MSKRNYEIAFVGLQQGIHNFEYSIEDSFFEAYHQQDFTNCKAIVNVSLEKNTGFMQLKFAVSGSVQAICDRCGNDLPVTLWDDFVLIVKLVENPDQMNADEEDPDVFYIGRQEGLLDIKDFIFEFVNLSIPNQKMCATDEAGNETCNKKALEMLQKLKDNNVESNTNSIWKDLEKFKNIDNN